MGLAVRGERSLTSAHLSWSRGRDVEGTRVLSFFSEVMCEGHGEGSPRLAGPFS